MNIERPIGAQQRALHQQAEAEARRRQQAGAQQRARMQNATNNPYRPPSPPAPPRSSPHGRSSSPGGGGQPPKRLLDGQSSWTRALIMVAITVAGSILLSIFVISSASDLFGLNKADNDIVATVPEGSTVAEVSSILMELGVIKQPLTFRMYMDFKKLGSEDIQPGEYVFNSSMAYDEIIIALRSGRSAKAQKRIAIIEGMTVREIASRLQAEGICNADEFIKHLNTAEFSFEFFGAIEDNPLRYHKLEGYLFPDSYDFFMGENVASVARKFLRNMDDKLTPDLLARMQRMNLTIDQTITLASIIQKEAGEIGDMSYVSSVFHNRLKAPGQFPRLQSDVTIFYVEKDIKPRLTHRNQDMYDAYNTYVREGLPVGPVCNPGSDAIEAALYPESSNFYYFVTDSKMQFYWADTLQKHEANQAKAAQVGSGEVHGVNTA